jgi:outer membrane protein OmpA-like peptidoglycan-associated protein
LKNFIPAFIIFILWAIFGYFWLAPKSTLAKETPTQINPLDTITFPPTGTLKLGAYDFPAGIQIFKQNTEIAIPENIQILKDSIFNTLNKKQNFEVVIIGKYPPKIVDSLSNEKQGISRAKALKKQLIDFGINPLKIKTKSKETLFKYDSDGIFANGIDLNYQKIAALDKINAATFKMHRFNYTKGKNIEITPKLECFIYELKYYLTNHPNKKAALVVFTDGDGSKAKNYWDGLDTATAFRKLLYKKYGIKKRQLLAISRGELDPIVDNKTADKLQNNRLEITIK